jgi:hypothetical protein
MGLDFLGLVLREARPMKRPDKIAAAFEEHKRWHRRLAEIEEALARPVEGAEWEQRRRELIRERAMVVAIIQREMR